jgi:hypothetical protein
MQKKSRIFHIGAKIVKNFPYRGKKVIRFGPDRPPPPHPIYGLFLLKEFGKNMEYGFSIRRLKISD